MSVESEETGLSQESEEALRSRPDYVAYYYANVRNNPRLPPPLTTRNANSPWLDNGKAMSPEGLAEQQAKADASDAQAQATFNLLFGNQLHLQDGTEPIPIRGGNYLAQSLGQQVSSSLGASRGNAVSPPDTLAAAWANINASSAANNAAQQLDSLLGAFGSPKPAVALSPLLTAELKAQASGVSLYSARSADEQAIHDALFVGSTPHTPMGSSHHGGAAQQLFGSSFNAGSMDSPRPTSLDLMGRSMSSNSLGGGGLGKDPKVAPGPGPSGRLASVIGDQRASLRTPSKLRIGTTVADPDPQQQLLNSLNSLNSLTSAAAAAAAAAGASGSSDPNEAAAAAAAAAQLASAAQVQAAVEAIQGLPPAAATAFAAALGGGGGDHQAGMGSVAGSPLVSPEMLLGGAGTQQQQIQAMYMAAAMYPMYYAQQAQQQAAGMQQSLQAMQAAAMAGFPGCIPGAGAATGGFPAVGQPGSMLAAPGYPPPHHHHHHHQMMHGLPHAHAAAAASPAAAAAALYGAAAAGPGMHHAAAAAADMAALAAAGLRPSGSGHQPFVAAGGAAYNHHLTMGAMGSGDYAAYYQKVLEAQAAAMAMAGAGAAGGGKDTAAVDSASAAAAAAALMRAGHGVPPPPPPPGQPKDKRHSGGEPQHGGGNGAGSGMYHQSELERRGRNSSLGRSELERLVSRASGNMGGVSPAGGPLASGGGGGGHNSRLRGASGSQTFVLSNADAPSHNPHGGLVSMNSLGANGGGGGGHHGGGGSHHHHHQHHHGSGLMSTGSGNFNAAVAAAAYPREPRGPDGGPQQQPRRSSQRRDAGLDPLGPAGSEPHVAGGGGGGGGVAGGGGGNSGGGPSRAPRSSGDSLLDEFKTNKTGRKYELREILGHVYEFSLDQHGSRFIQQKLEGVLSEDLDAAFAEVLPRVLHLMTDVFGNYVVQKFLEHGSLEHRARLAKALHGHVLQLSLQMYGCRVVQKALEVFTEEQQVEVVAELDGHIMRCVRDQNGNHVIQKCIECVPTPRIIGLLDTFLLCVGPLSTHPFGCRIIQRILEHVRDQRRRTAVMSDILASAVQLTQDQYGNYVIQHVLERGTPEERSSIAGSLASTVVQLSMHKFASNVIEKCLTYGSTADRDLLINRMLGAAALQMQQQQQAGAVPGGMDGDGEVEDPVQAMMKDQFGNYVVQKVLEVCSDEQREAMLARVRQQLHALKRFTYGKHIVARVEKLLSAGTRYQTHAKGRLLPDDEAIAAAAAAAGGAAARLGSGSGVAPAAATGAAAVDGDGSVATGAMACKDSVGSDGGASTQPSAPTTPPAAASPADTGYSGPTVTAAAVAAAAAAAAAAAPSEGYGNSPTAAPVRPSSGLVGAHSESM